MTVRERRRVLVVGAGGLLGGAVSASLETDETVELTRAVVPWRDADASVTALVRQVTDLIADEGGWTLLWCAGAGVVASSGDALATERAVIAESLEAVGAVIAADPTRATRGTVLVASSAGGVYAGALGSPFSETTEPHPLAPYGWSKLAVEELFASWAASTGVPVVIARYSNLYGPGQDTSKAQGLVSQLCLAHLRNKPSSIFVPTDTIRDYLFIDDAAQMTIALARRAESLEPGSVVVKILAAQQGVTIGALIGELQRIVKRRPRIVWGSHFTASVQAPDLRFESIVWTDLDERMLTPLPAGIHRTLLALQEGDPRA